MRLVTQYSGLKVRVLFGWLANGVSVVPSIGSNEQNPTTLHYPGNALDACNMTYALHNSIVIKGPCLANSVKNN